MADKKIDALEKANNAEEGLELENAKASAADVIKDFSQVDVTQLQGMTQEYLQLNENKTYNLVFRAMTKFKSERGEVDAVELIDEKGNSFINGNTVLVNSLRKVQKLPCLVRIVTGKLEKAQSGGKYLDMDVYVLPKVANATGD